MALGDTNQNKTVAEPSYYSRLRISNYDTKLTLGFTYWKGTLKISIAEMGSANEGRNNELAYIHLSPMKARLFADCVQKIIKDPETFDIFGVDSGSGETRGFIAIGRDMGKPYLFIARVNNDGSYESSQKFIFNEDYHYALKVNDINKLSYQKIFYNNSELEEFRDLLVDYAKAASGAIAASVWDIGRYENNKVHNLIKKIGEKNGIDTGSQSSNRSGYSNNSFFSNQNDSNNKSSNSTKKNEYQTIDDLEDELE